MWRKISGAMAIALLACGCQRPPAVKTDRDRAELKGPVKTVVTEFAGNVKDRWGQADRRAVGSETYDLGGNLIADEQYTPDFVRKRKVEHKSANLIVFHSIMGDATVRRRFDTRGNLVEEEEKYGLKFTGPADNTTRYRYDDMDRLIERDFVLPNGKLGGVSSYKRDKGGNTIAEESWLNDIRSPHAYMRYRYDFDPHGNWVKRYETRTGVPEDAYWFGHTGTLIRTITYFGGTAPPR